MLYYQQRPQPRSYAGAIITGFALALCGAIIAGVIWIMVLSDARAARSWPTTSGVVVSTQVVPQVDHDGFAGYATQLLYQYAVDGQRYSAGRITVADATRGRAAAERIAARYPVGTPVTVHYNPERPQSALLDTNTPLVMSAIIYGGLFLTAIGVLLLLGALVAILRRRRRAQAMPAQRGAGGNFSSHRR